MKLLASHIVWTGGSRLPQHDWGVIRMSERGFGPDPVDLQVGKNVGAKRTELGLSQDYIADQLALRACQGIDESDRREWAAWIPVLGGALYRKG
jgi:hypothetical protein